MKKVYTYHDLDHNLKETSFTLKYPLAETIIEEGGYIKVWDASSTNADVELDCLTTMDEVEGVLVAEERLQWKSSAKVATEEKLIDNNLKTAAAAGKPSLAAVPPIAFFALGAAMSDGAQKYGRFNWRETTVTSSVFYDAMMRHLLAWWNGEDHALDSLVHHLGHLQAGAAIILDGELNGILNDDRDKHNKVDIEAIMKIVKKRH